MSILTGFESEHRELDETIALIRALIVGDGPDPDGRLAASRWRLSFLIARHMSVEDTHIYPLLAGDDRPEVAAIVARFTGRIGLLRADVRQYQADWTPARIEAEWPAFQAATRALLDDVEQRIAIEEAELFPLIAETEARRRN